MAQLKRLFDAVVRQTTPNSSKTAVFRRVHTKRNHPTARVPIVAYKGKNGGTGGRVQFRLLPACPLRLPACPPTPVPPLQITLRIRRESSPDPQTVSVGGGFNSACCLPALQTCLPAQPPHHLISHYGYIKGGSQLRQEEQSVLAFCFS